MTEPAPPRLLWLASGFVVWSSAFLALYGLQALGCAYRWPDLVHRGALFALFAAHLVAIGLILRQVRRRPKARFLDTVTLWALWAALVSTVLNYAPALALTACSLP
jgi:heme A synthase